MNSRFPAWSKGMRWLMAAAVAFWTVTGTAAMPLMSATECAEMAMSAAGCDRMEHHAATPHHASKESPAPQQHECCKKKPKSKPAPTKANMPMCPMQEGTMPHSCGMAEVTCCAVMSRDDTRRTAKTEKSNEDETPTLLMAKARPGPYLEQSDRHDRHLQDGLRYEKPVFDLKADLRI